MSEGPIKIVLAGGGTGGHITPLIAVAEAIKQQSPTSQLVYIGEGSRAERELLADSKLPVHRIWAGKWRRFRNRPVWEQMLDVKTNALNLRDSFKFGIGVMQSLQLLRKLKPDAVFVKGGYVGLPVGLAAALLKLPLIIHESDARAGLANRRLAKHAQRIATGLPVNYYPESWQAKAVFTGIPVRRPESRPTVTTARKLFGLDATEPVVLIVGGSSGAVAINEAVAANLVALLARYQIIHISGTQHYAAIKQGLAALKIEHKNRYKLYDFMATQLPAAIVAADLVIARAGMSTVAEVAAAGKPLLLVPAPQLSDQQRNAEALARHGAAVIIDQSQLPNQLPQAAADIISSAAKRQQLAANIKQFARPDAAQAVAKLILASSGAAS